MFKIAWYELKKMFRNTRWIIITILQPIILVTLMSLTAYQDPTGIKVIAYNRDQNEYSQRIIDKLRVEKDFDFIEYQSENDLINDIRQDKAKMAVVVDIGRRDSLVRGSVEAINNSTVPEISFISKLKISDILKSPIEDLSKDNIQFKIDQSIEDKKYDFETSKNSFIENLKTKISQQGLPLEIQQKVASTIEGESINANFSMTDTTDIPKIEIIDSDNSVRGLKYFDLYASALLIVITLMITLKVSDTSITEERSEGTFERFFVTPFRKYHMIGGKMIAFTFLNIFIVGILIATMIMLTHISIGPIWLVSLLCFLTALSSAALGILVSSLTYTVNESIQTSNLLFFSSIIVIGFLFQPETMNKYVKYITYAFPFTYSIRAMREINLLGMGFYDVWRDLLIVFAFTILLIIISILALKRKAT